MRSESDRLKFLTQKQREVLDLLIQFKTSKEIAIELGISPHTVDQRIQFAKRAFGVEVRSELAQRYRTAVQIYDRTTYEDSYLSGTASARQQPGTDIASTFLAPNAANQLGSGATQMGKSLVPELFEGRYGVLFRLGAIALTAFFLVMAVLGGMAIFSVITEVLIG